MLILIGDSDLDAAALSRSSRMRPLNVASQGIEVPGADQVSMKVKSVLARRHAGGIPDARRACSIANRSRVPRNSPPL